MENKLSQKQKLWLLLAVIGAGINCWLMVMVGRIWRENLNRKQQVSQLQQELKQMDELGLEKQILTEKLAKLESFFVDGEKGVALVAASLETAAAKTGVSLNLNLEDFPTQVSLKTKNQLGLGINVQAEGSYQAILNWLKTVESLPYFILFDEAKVGLTRLGTGVKAEFKGVIFLKNGSS